MVLSQRFWDQVEKTDSCWIWTGWINPHGYGVFGGRPRPHLAHRLSYIEARGEIQGDLVLDHVCHGTDPSCAGGAQCLHRRCVNPEHLEPVTRSENVKRGVRSRMAHCSRGHEFNEENTRWGNGALSNRRQCRTCAREQRKVRLVEQ